MKLINSDFKITGFNIDGTINFDRKYDLVKVENPVEYNSQWQMGVTAPIANLVLKATYRQRVKVNNSNLCVYETETMYTFLMDGMENQNEAISEVYAIQYKKMAEGYNDKIKGTKLQTPFPEDTEKSKNQFCQQTLRNLHNAIQTLQDFQRKK